MNDDALIRSLAPVLTPQGWALLDSLPPYREAEALRLGSQLREQGHPPETVAAVLTQARLRAKGAEKFGEFASSMLFTPDGLEQATRLPIAALHARRFQRAQIGSVADLGCGIGGDAMALAGLGLEVLAVDRDPATVAVATVNLRPFPTARVRLGTAEEHRVEETEGIWLDPARRRTSGGRTRRTHAVEEYEPSLETVATLAARVAAVGAKLGPAVPHDALPEGTETQWLSWHGQVLEATCWFGPLAEPGVTRSALVIDRAGAHRLTASPTSDPVPGPVGAHVYEPDGAVIRAGLIGVLAARHAARTLDPSIAYLTADHRVMSPFWRGYTVRDVMPFSLKGLQGYLREHRIGIVEIKKRGTAVEPEQLRRQLRPRRFGEESATLILTRIAGAQHVIIAEPHRVRSRPCGR